MAMSMDAQGDHANPLDYQAFLRLHSGCQLWSRARRSSILGGISLRALRGDSVNRPPKHRVIRDSAERSWMVRDVAARARSPPPREVGKPEGGLPAVCEAGEAS